MMILCSDDAARGAGHQAHPGLGDQPAASPERGSCATSRTLRRALKEDFGIVEPRIAVMALNPHAGDGGLLGREEQEIIRPAVVEAFRIRACWPSGRLPPTGFSPADGYAKYDGILAMYHDQGLAPFKSAVARRRELHGRGFRRVRTSPDHGTAYDIAGKDKADPQSMRSVRFTPRSTSSEHRRAWAEWTPQPAATRRARAAAAATSRSRTCRRPKRRISAGATKNRDPGRRKRKKRKSKRHPPYPPKDCGQGAARTETTNRANRRRIPSRNCGSAEGPENLIYIIL